MNFLNAMDISSSGLTAQRNRINLSAMNLSHMQTTRTPEGGPYRRKMPVFSTEPLFQGFRGRLQDGLNRELEDVQVQEVIEDKRDFKMVFDPSHPEADEFGYVLMPNINVVEEMVDIISAGRSYEANITALKSSQNMALKALEILA